MPGTWSAIAAGALQNPSSRHVHRLQRAGRSLGLGALLAPGDGNAGQDLFVRRRRSRHDLRFRPGRVRHVAARGHVYGPAAAGAAAACLARPRGRKYLGRIAARRECRRLYRRVEPRSRQPDGRRPGSRRPLFHDGQHALDRLQPHFARLRAERPEHDRRYRLFFLAGRARPGDAGTQCRRDRYGDRRRRQHSRPSASLRRLRPGTHAVAGGALPRL
ncbi:hypothetical protein AB7M37_002993 [Sinorhizobium fredii]